VQGELVAASVRALAGGRPGGLGVWSKPPDAAFVSLGRRDGIGHLGPCACTGIFIRKAKSEHLNIAKTRKAFRVRQQAG
jgi:hypothetical protein